jgi:hypothetical protein
MARKQPRVTFYAHHNNALAAARKVAMREGDFAGFEHYEQQMQSAGDKPAAHQAVTFEAFVQHCKAPSFPTSTFANCSAQMQG